MSCIFTCTQRPRRRVPGPRRPPAGPRPGAAPVRPRDRRARRPAARDPAARALLRRARRAGAPRVPARGGGAAARPRGRPVSRLEFNTRVGEHPGLPGRRHLRLRRRAREAGLERDALAAAPAGARGRGGRDARRSTAIPDPTTSLLRKRISERTGVPVGARDRGQRLLRDPAGRRRGDARAGRRDRVRVAVLLDVPAPRRDDRRPRGHRAAGRGRAATTWRPWPARSPRPRAS